MSRENKDITLTHRITKQGEVTVHKDYTHLFNDVLTMTQHGTAICF